MEEASDMEEAAEEASSEEAAEEAAEAAGEVAEETGEEGFVPKEPKDSDGPRIFPRPGLSRCYRSMAGLRRPRRSTRMRYPP